MGVNEATNCGRRWGRDDGSLSSSDGALSLSSMSAGERKGVGGIRAREVATEATEIAIARVV